MEFYMMLFILFICICFLIMCAYRQIKYSENKADEDNENIINKSQNENDEESDNEKEMNTSPFISCDCPALAPGASGHMGRMEHKLECPKFWALNPNRTKKELLKVEHQNAKNEHFFSTTSKDVEGFA